MGISSRTKRIIRFDGFEADLQTGELQKNGQKIPLPEKPFQVLALLLEHAGEMVSREEIHRRLWPTGIYVDFDHNLNITIARLRRALSDSSEHPKFIETVGSRGYRFIGHIIENKEQPESSPSEQYQTEEGKIRLAVLPFANLCPGPETIWLSDGLTEEIITRLGHRYSHRLGVIARTSTLKYKGTTKDIGQIGRELKVGYILEGSVRCVGDRMHITAQLVRVRDQTHLWAENYEYEMCDVLAVQNEVAEKIAQTLGGQLLPSEKANVVRRYTPNQEAYLSYLKGHHHQSRRSQEDLMKSVECFNRAIQEDQNYPQAYSSLAVSLVLQGFVEGPPRDFFLPAKEAALKALRLDDTLAESHTALALVKFFYEWDWVAAEQLLCRAIELNPSDAFAYQVYSYYLSSNGRHAEALSAGRQASELDPLSLSTIVSLGTAHYFVRQYNEAIAVLQEVLDLEPTFRTALMYVGAAYSQNSQHQEAILTLEKAEIHHPTNTPILASLGETYAKAGMREKACGVIDKLETLSKLRYVSAFDIALVHAGLGQTDTAFERLERAYQERSPFLVFLPVEPRLDNLRDDPRRESLSHRIGFAQKL